MLVLTRKLQESVAVGGSSALAHMLKVTVVEIRRGHVKLAFEAPGDVPIHRWELRERIRANGRPELPTPGA